MNNVTRILSAVEQGDGLPVVADIAAMPTEPPKAEPPKRNRRWFRFSLRTLMIGVTLLAVACAYVGWQAKIVGERRALRESCSPQ